MGTAGETTHKMKSLLLIFTCLILYISGAPESRDTKTSQSPPDADLLILPKLRRRYNLAKLQNRDDNQLKDAVYKLDDSFDEADKSGALDDGIKSCKPDFRDLRDYRDLIKKMKDSEDVDWKPPSQEMVATVTALTEKIIERLKNCNSFVQKHPQLKTLLDITEMTLDVASKAIDAAWDTVNFINAIKAAEANPAGAVGAAFAGPDIAKKGINFIRWIDPNLDTDEETKKVEQNVFGMVGGGASAGASIGGLVGTVGGPPGMAIGAALGGLAGSVIGAVGFAFG